MKNFNYKDWVRGTYQTWDNPTEIQDEPNYCEDCGEIKEELDSGEEVCIRCMNEEEELHEEAKQLMEELDNKYNRETSMSLDEYQQRFKFTQQEYNKITNLIEKF